MERKARRGGAEKSLRIAEEEGFAEHKSMDFASGFSRRAESSGPATLAPDPLSDPPLPPRLRVELFAAVSESLVLSKAGLLRSFKGPTLAMARVSPKIREEPKISTEG